MWALWLGIGFVAGVLVMAVVAVALAMRAAPYVIHEVYRE